MNADTVIRALSDAPRLYSRAEILARPSPVPRESGIYAWYFREIPPGVPTEGCHRVGALSLLYVGISPKAPPRNGARASEQTLWHRVRYHMRGNAYGSTLRLTLGCLLSSELGIALRRVGNGTRLTFAQGEARLSGWLDANAYVTWLACRAPWVPEPAVIHSLSLRLNLEHNSTHPFYAKLRRIRESARANARGAPIAAA